MLLAVVAVHLVEVAAADSMDVANTVALAVAVIMFLVLVLLLAVAGIAVVDDVIVVDSLYAALSFWRGLRKTGKELGSQQERQPQQ